MNVQLAEPAFRYLTCILLLVDASEAGSGDLDVEVSCNGQLVRIKREPLGQSQYRYTYVPKQGGEHLIDVQYNYERVPGGLIANGNRNSNYACGGKAERCVQIDFKHSDKWKKLQYKLETISNALYIFPGILRQFQVFEYYII